ncbi:MAG: hypothetical protein J2P21_01715 [Chloracidobacterium sp.]|nr:hypothetical protein [Chloracidobacterium sp.]
MPPAYADLEVGWGDIWAPLTFSGRDLRAQPYRARFVRVVGRLKTGVTVAQAQARMDVVQRQLQRETPRLLPEAGRSKSNRCVTPLVAERGPRC